MNIQRKDNRAVTSSRDVAETFGKLHKDVLKAIQNIECSEDFNRRNFAPITYIDTRGRVQPEYEMTRDGFTLLAMGFTGKDAMNFKEDYIAAFNAMEKRIIDENSLTGIPALKAMIAVMEKQQAEINNVQATVKAIAVNSNYTPGYFTIMGYASMHKRHVSVQEAASLGRSARQICNNMGYKIETMPDPRFGRVNLYPMPVLASVFNPEF
jgi:Rha family phage regulatory protein